jgi:hypothetical protein
VYFSEKWGDCLVFYLTVTVLVVVLASLKGLLIPVKAIEYLPIAKFQRIWEKFHPELFEES